MKKRNISGIADAVFKEIFSDKSILVEYINQICNINLDEKNVEYCSLETKSHIYRKGVRYDVKGIGAFENQVFHIDFEAQSYKPSDNTFNKRKFHYISELFNGIFTEGDIYDDNRELSAKSIFFIREASNFTGSPIKKIVFHDLYDNYNYREMEIYEIYINELMSIDLNEANDYVKMLVELTGILVADDVEKYIGSNNATVRKVANMIMKYTEEEIKALQRQYDKEVAAEERDILAQLKQQAWNSGLAEGIAAGKAEGLVEGRAEGLAEGKAEGKAEGIAEGEKNALEKNIKIMYSNGFDEITIAKALSLDLNYVKKVLNS